MFNTFSLEVRPLNLILNQFIVHILVNCFPASAGDENFVFNFCFVFFSCWHSVYYRYVSHCLAAGSPEWYKTASLELYHAPQPVSWTQVLPSNRDPGKVSVEFNAFTANTAPNTKL